MLASGYILRIYERTNSGFTSWTVASGCPLQQYAEMHSSRPVIRSNVRHLIGCVSIGIALPSMQGWLGSKDAMLHAGEGTIQTARWSGTLVAWANNIGVKVPFQPFP